MAGIQLDARDQPNNFHNIGRTFATNGTYSIGVQASTWNVVSNSSDLANQGYIGWATNVTVTTGQSTNLNFVVLRTNWPVLHSPVHVSPAEFQFVLNGLAGQNYTIQASTNLGGGTWFPLLMTNAPCDTVLILDPNATIAQRFYRAEQTP